MDECEGILGRLEQLVAAPEASPSTILALIPMIASATMPTNRTLSPWLRHRLDEVAKHHGGSVPLHGRLFTQWLHYAYPRECNFPHTLGSINPQRPEDIIESKNATEDDISANENEMKRVVAAASPVKHRIPGSDAHADEESAMWSMDEELVVWREPQQPVWTGSMGARGIAVVG